MKKQLLFLSILLLLVFSPTQLFSQFVTTGTATANNLYTGGRVGIGTTTAPTFGTNRFVVTGNSLFSGDVVTSSFFGTQGSAPLMFKMGNINAGKVSFYLYGNTSFGYNSLPIQDGLDPNENNNTAIGYYSLFSHTTGNGNTATGAQSLRSNTTGSSNNAFGQISLYSNMTGNNNNAFGSSSLYNNKNGFDNNAFGTGSLLANTAGGSNNAFGSSSLRSNETGGDNNAFGTNALFFNTTSSFNNAFGNFSLYNNSTGTGNNAFGFKSLFKNTIGESNNAFGRSSMNENTTGYYNSAFGDFSLTSNTIGTQNTAIGYSSGGGLTGGNSNLFLGVNTQPNISNTSSNQINIANAIYGYNANIGIGVFAPTARFHTIGSVRFEGIGANTINSDTKIVTADVNGNVFTRNATNQLSLVNNTLTSIVNGVPSATITLPTATPAAAGWLLGGNPLTIGDTSFLGTITDNDLVFKRNSALAGKIGIYNTSFGLGSSLTGLGSGNTVFGIGNLVNNQSGYDNTAFGISNLTNNMSGINNTAIGKLALNKNIDGFSNIAIGTEALYRNTSGNKNTVIGAESMHFNTTGGSNTSVGAASSSNISTGTGNSALGVYSLILNETGNVNTAIGNGAGYSLTSGDNNLFLGSNTNPNFSNTGSNQINIGNAVYGYNGDIGIGALVPGNKFEIKSNATSPSPSGLRFSNLNNTSASTTNPTNKILSVNATGDVVLVDDKIGTASPTAAGWLLSGNPLTPGDTSFLGTTTDNDLVFKRNSVLSGKISVGSASFGRLALASSTNNSNAAFGDSALFTNATGSDNNAFGNSALYFNTIGSSNNAFGTASLHKNTTGGSNNAFGTGSLYSNTVGYANNSFGNQSLSNNISGFNNNAFGNQSLRFNTIGRDNNAIGSESLIFNTEGYNNNAFGSRALFGNNKGYNNSAFGAGSLFANTTGVGNNAFGVSSLGANNGTNNNAFGGSSLVSNTTGSYNSALGDSAGSGLISGDNNLFLGYNTQPNISTTSSNQINIGNAIYGYNSNIGIGVFAPTARFHNKGTVRFENLGSNFIDTNFLTTDAAGNVTTRNISSLLAASNLNIYNSDGTLKNDRFASLGGNDLNFQDKNVTAILSPRKFYNQVDSFSSVKMIRQPLFQEPNINGWGMFNIQDANIGNSLTQGISKEATWIQSSKVGVSQSPIVISPIGAADSIDIGSAVESESLPLLINPNQGNVGVGVLNPTAQLHTINSVRFENLPFNNENTAILTTDGVGNVTNRVFNNWDTTNLLTLTGNNLTSNVNGVSSSIILPSSPPAPSGWLLNGNALTTGNEFLGTTNDNDLFFKRNNELAGKISLNSTSFGLKALLSNTGIQNNAFGNFSLFSNITGFGNNAFGNGSLAFNTTGDVNSAFGNGSLASNITGSSNNAFGNSSLYSNLTGESNNAFGTDALSSNLNGNSNNAFGSSALTYSDGNNNVGIGNLAGSNLTLGDNNLFLGANTQPNISNTSSNQLNIGNAIYGYNGDIGIGVLTPGNKFEIKSNPNSLTPAGLRFTNLNNTSNSSFNQSGKILSVNLTGDVILVDDKLGLTTTTNQLSLSGNNLTSNVNGVSSSVDLSSLITPSVNIYNNNGTLLQDRIVAMDSKTLNFNFSANPLTPSLNGVIISPALTNSSNLSLKVNRFDAPNLFGYGHSNIKKSNSFLTSGYNQNYFWIQASTDASEVQNPANYMINPLGGKVAIGTTNINLDADCPDCNDYRLFVKQGIRTEKVRVDVATVKGWADYVFDKDYSLMPLQELEKFVITNKHLPSVPNAEEVVKTGIDLGQMNAKLLEKVEELTLYTIDINKKNTELEKAKDKQEVLIKSLIERLEKLEKNSK